MRAGNPTRFGVLPLSRAAAARNAIAAEMFGPPIRYTGEMPTGEPLKQRRTIILHHFVGQMPLAGIAWQAMHYLVGLQRLGYDVWYIEDGGANPYDPRVASVMMTCDYNVAYLRRAMESYGFAGRWAYWDAINDEWHGLSRERVNRLYREADALINLCGATQLREEHLCCPVRIMIDSDPIYEQIKYAEADPAARAYLDAHTHFFSYGENLGSADCPIPLSGLGWRATRPPIVLDLWSEAEDAGDSYTTIATWENKGKNIEFRGSRYFWSKHVNFLRFIELPQRRPRVSFTLAMDPPDAAVRALVTKAGWNLVDPGPISAEMDAYRDFISHSRGEFTVAKDIYVRPNSGWFSDRSVCYLAAGRPVVTMRTGFSKFYPVGRGLFEFTTEDEALAAIDTIVADYPTHSRAARELAREYFAADRVLGALMATLGL
jgi:hypothetical protein